MGFLKGIAQYIGVRDVILLVGLTLLAFGCWLAWEPAAAIVPGAVLTWYAVRSR